MSNIIDVEEEEELSQKKINNRRRSLASSSELRNMFTQIDEPDSDTRIPEPPSLESSMDVSLTFLQELEENIIAVEFDLSHKSVYYLLNY